MTPPRTIDEVLAEARGRLDRLTPEEAEAARAAGGGGGGGRPPVDIRPAAQRAAEGELSFATVIERNVLEWRLDPSSDASLPVASHDLEVVVLCQEGYTSSLAAAALQDLGIHRATDVIGGYAAWRAWLDEVPPRAEPSDDEPSDAAVPPTTPPS
jgi:rhodanese-related sulfurtransferase